MEAILKRLENDKDYYGEFGKKFLSNSDIYTLLNNPRGFRQPVQETKALIEGRYFHTFMLEPDKIETFKISTSKSRNSTAYKKDLYDYDEKMKANFKFFDDIYANTNKYEVPGIVFLKGEQWKGKADVLCEDKIIDLKTTSDISKFHLSAKKYNYDSQAYIYQQIFGVPVHFYVIDKTSMLLGIYKPSESFLESGERKVERAVNIYRQFFSEDSEISIDDFYFDELLN